MKARALHVDGLSLHAGGLARRRCLFASLSFAVAAGERWVVVGPNGVGKSSLLAAIAGVFPIAAGTVRLDGRLLNEWSMTDLAAARAWSPQFWSDAFPSTVIETAALAHRRRVGWHFETEGEPDAAVLSVLNRLGLASLARSDVRSLSGGERQRVALATALLQEAALLLLDEPASHLDPAHQRMLLGVLREHTAGGGAVIASLHDLNLAWDLATHAILLDGTGAATVGRRDEVFTAARLGAVFGVAIDTVQVGAATRFLIADAPLRPVHAGSS